MALSYRKELRLKQGRYGFREYGIKVGLNNLLLCTTTKVLGIRGFYVQYKNDPPFIVVTEESYPEIWKELTQ